MKLERLQNETPFEWKLRLCLAKKRREIDKDWSEIVDILNLDISPDQLRKQAVGYEEYDNYINGFDGVCNTILSISDLHIPYNLPKELLNDYVGKVDILQINGDIVDCQALSKFSKQYRISPMEELIVGRQYVIDLINYIKPKKKVVINYGNHDKRFASYFAKNIDTDILELLPDTSLELMINTGFTHYDKRSGAKIWYEPIKNLFDIEVEYVDDWKVKIGKTWFVHPLAYRSGMLATCDKAKDYLQDTDPDYFDCVVMAHTHSIGDSKKGFIRLLEQGAFADVNSMSYADGRLTKPQREGFAIICQDKDGNLIQDKTKIISLN